MSLGSRRKTKPLHSALLWCRYMLSRPRIAQHGLLTSVSWRAMRFLCTREAGNLARRQVQLGAKTKNFHNSSRKTTLRRPLVSDFFLCFSFFGADVSYTDLYRAEPYLPNKSRSSSVSILLCCHHRAAVSRGHYQAVPSCYHPESRLSRVDY